MRFFLTVMVSAICLIAQDSVNVFEQSRLQEDNLLNQMLKKENKLRFINMRNHDDLVNGSLRIDDMTFPIKNGVLKLPEDKISMMNSPFEAYFSGRGYVSTRFIVNHAFGAVDDAIFYVLDAKMPNKVQIVLNWDNRGVKNDLDSHLKSNSLHVYYRNKASYGRGGARAFLNRDVINGNAYELIVIDKPSNNDNYLYYVNRYRGRSDWHKKKVTVYVFVDNELKHRYRLNYGGNRNITNWNVFQLTSDGQIIYKNSVN